MGQELLTHGVDAGRNRFKVRISSEVWDIAGAVWVVYQFRLRWNSSTLKTTVWAPAERASPSTDYVDLPLVIYPFSRVETPDVPEIYVKLGPGKDNVKVDFEEGYYALNYWLHFLGKYDDKLKFPTWQKLCTILPREEIPLRRALSPPLPFQDLANLQHLEWTGHPSNLLSSWVPLSPPIISRLKILIIRCHMSVSDSACIIYHGRRLEKLDIRTIHYDHITESVMPRIRSSAKVVRPYLHTLILLSVADMTPLLQPFHFPALDHLKLYYKNAIPYSGLGDLKGLNWENLDEVIICADILHEENEILQRICVKARHFLAFSPFCLPATWYNQSQ
ncbi:hypothetical protein H0H93_013735 [Arthromyces matolae]|nr:hypothetical protein H0H93_013735 [Arthromyces matolae]